MPLYTVKFHDETLESKNADSTMAVFRESFEGDRNSLGERGVATPAG